MRSERAYEITLGNLHEDLKLWGWMRFLSRAPMYRAAIRVSDLFTGSDYAVMRSSLRDELRKLVWDAMPQGSPEFGAAIIVERVVGPWLAKFFLGQEGHDSAS